MDYEIVVRVSAEEKVIDIPWEDIKNDFINFTLEKVDPDLHKSFAKVLAIVESRIKNVFLDRCKKSLIQ